MDPHAALHALARSHTGKRALAAFDWDDTCIEGDIGLSVLALLDSRDGGDRLQRYHTLDAAQGATASYPFCTTVLAGHTRDELRELGRQVLEQGLAQGRIKERPRIQALIRDLSDNGWEIWVVTASPAACVEPSAERYGIPADRVLGMELTPDETGRLLGVLVEPAPWGAQKTMALQARAGRPPTLALSDSPNDVPLLASAQHAVAVGSSPALAHIAKAQGWLHLESP